MAIYNNGFPMTYQQYYPQYQQPYMAQPQNPQAVQNPQMNQQQLTPQIQNGGFVPVPNIEVARSYHVSPGTSVTFIDENAPYVYVKTRGFSQLDPPVFKKKRLVDEEDVPPESLGSPESHFDGLDDKLKGYVSKTEFEAFRGLYEELKTDYENLKKELLGNDE